jgi:hypothetical protein
MCGSKIALTQKKNTFQVLQKVVKCPPGVFIPLQVL